MKSAVKIKLIVDEPTAAYLDGQSRICNWAYNHLLDPANGLRTEYVAAQNPELVPLLYTENGLRDLLPTLKDSAPFLKAVPSSPLKNAVRRLSRCIQTYQKNKQKEKKKQRAVGWPSFRSWAKNWFSLEYDEPKKGWKLEGQQLQLSFGKNEKGKQLHVAVQLADPLPNWIGTLKTCQIVKELGLFYVSFTMERALPAAPLKRPEVIALDPNHKNLAVGVSTTGKSIELANAYFIRSLEQRLDDVKSLRDKCVRKSNKIDLPEGRCYWKPSRRWEYRNTILQDLDRTRREQTKTFLYTLANALYTEFDVVAIGDYTPNGGGITTGMRRAMNNFSRLGRAKEVLAWVAQKKGKTFLEWNEYRSTKTCCRCKHVVKKGIPLDVREWTCPQCQTFHLRDENAAQNGLIRVLQELQLSGSDQRPQVIVDRCIWRFDGLGVARRTPGAAIARKRQAWSRTTRELNRSARAERSIPAHI